MDRRGFLKMFSAGAAGLALEQAIPFGRVWSFPSKIVIPELTLRDLESLYLTPAAAALSAKIAASIFQIGDVVTVKPGLEFPGYAGPFVVAAVTERDCWLKAPRHHIAAIAPPEALEPLVIPPKVLEALL